MGGILNNGYLYSIVHFTYKKEESMGEKIQKKGMLFLSQTTTDAALGALEDSGIKPDHRMELEAQVEKPKGLDRRCQFYILVGSICYRVYDDMFITEEIWDILGDDRTAGIPVTFTTPAVKQGRYGWAYDIALAR